MGISRTSKSKTQIKRFNARDVILYLEHCNRRRNWNRMTKYEDGYSLGRAAAQQEIINKLLELVKNLEGKDEKELKWMI